MFGPRLLHVLVEGVALSVAWRQLASASRTCVSSESIVHLGGTSAVSSRSSGAIKHPDTSTTPPVASRLHRAGTRCPTDGSELISSTAPWQPASTVCSYALLGSDDDDLPAAPAPRSIGACQLFPLPLQQRAAAQSQADLLDLDSSVPTPPQPSHKTPCTSAQRASIVGQQRRRRRRYSPQNALQHCQRTPIADSFVFRSNSP